MASATGSIPSGAGAGVVAAVDSEDALLGHRAGLARAREIVAGLASELVVTVRQPELFERTREIVEPSGEVPTADQLGDMRAVFGLERQAWTLNAAGGTDGLPMVYVRDHTGRGDPDAPRQVPA